MSPRAAFVLLGTIALASALPASAGVRVVATIHPIADLASRIGGDAVAVTTLLPAGASPHTFEPSPAQMRDVAGARVFVRVGAGLDAWTDKLVGAGGPDLEVVTLTNGIPLLAATGENSHDDAGEPGNAGDPHVWLDPILVRDHLVPAITAALRRAAPAESERFSAAAAVLSGELAALDAEIRAALAPLPRRRYVAFHAAWAYFARRYGLEEAGVIESSPGKEPSARSVAALVERARAAGVHALLVEPQFSPRVAEQIGREFGATTRTVDPVGGPGVPQRSHYVDLMRFNAGAFAEAMR